MYFSLYFLYIEKLTSSFCSLVVDVVFACLYLNYEILLVAFAILPYLIREPECMLTILCYVIKANEASIVLPSRTAAKARTIFLHLLR